MCRLLLLVVLFYSCNQAGDIPGDQKQNPVLQVMESIQYGDEAVQVADLYLPQQNNNGIFILYIHGGGWSGGSRKEAVHWAQAFQAMGYTVACIDYHLADGTAEHAHPRQVQDIHKAITFFRTAAGKYKYDSNKMVILGASAGSHLGLLYANKYDSTRQIKAAILLCGVYDLSDPALATPVTGDVSLLRYAAPFLGDPINAKTLEAASPSHYFSERSVPTWLIHGAEDELVTASQSVNAHKKLSMLNIPTHLTILPGIGHNLLDVDLTGEFEKADVFVRAQVK